MQAPTTEELEKLTAGLKTIQQAANADGVDPGALMALMLMATQVKQLEVQQQTLTEVKALLAQGEASSLAFATAGEIQVSSLDSMIELPPAIGTTWQGGIYAGIMRGGRKGEPDYHLVLRPEGVRPGPCTWQQALDWASEISAEDSIAWALPDRRESRLLYINLQDQFEPTWYWTNEQYSAHFAWGQWFDDGLQDGYGKGLEGRARAVRRLVIQPFNPF